MSDTPRTDKAWASWGYAGPGVHANFARKLERELNVAKERIEYLEQAIKTQILDSPRLNELAAENPDGRPAQILAHFKGVLDC